MSVTIILATYQGEKFLPAQLDSLTRQTESDFQVLFQDDGSSDRTLSLLHEQSRKDSRFHTAAEHGRHLGAAGNFFSLLRQAKGDYILLCDQDDIWESDKVECLLHACIEAEGKDSSLPILVHSDASVIDENDRLLAPSFFALEGWDPQAVNLNQLLVQNNATGCMMLINRPLADLIISHGDPSTMFMHDWFFVLSAAAFGKVIFVNRPLTRYRQHGKNTIGASRASLWQRALRALHEKDKARARIILTYSHTQAFQQAYHDILPPPSAKVVEAYLETQAQPKLKRILSLCRHGFLMQSPITRFGQFLFG